MSTSTWTTTTSATGMPTIEPEPCRKRTASFRGQPQGALPSLGLTTFEQKMIILLEMKASASTCTMIPFSFFEKSSFFSIKVEDKGIGFCFHSPLFSELRTLHLVDRISPPKLGVRNQLIPDLCIIESVSRKLSPCFFVSHYANERQHQLGRKRTLPTGALKAHGQ